MRKRRPSRRGADLLAGDRHRLTKSPTTAQAAALLGPRAMSLVLHLGPDTSLAIALGLIGIAQGIKP